MSKLSKALIAAAGNAGGEALYVEDVFSTYLYEGTGSGKSISNGIALGDFGLGTSTQFDGTADYLNRSSDLAGNSDGKTFTFSCWVFLPPKLNNDQRMIYATDSSDNGFMVYIRDDNRLGIEAWNGGVRTLQASTSTVVATETWTNIIVSLDTANTSNRSVYFNDSAASVTWSTYNNANIEFTRPTHYIGAWGNGTRKFYGNFAHLYLDYTYRDLSTESNRRIFIDGNGGSTSASSLVALSPIVYLPMTDAYSVGENAGTGGDFTATGSPTIVNKGTEYQAGYGEGGLVWIKARTVDPAFPNAYPHNLFSQDSGFGYYYSLESNSTSAQKARSSSLQTFNSDGFSIDLDYEINQNGLNYASWTFRKAEKFFDVVTYTGNGVAGRTVSHNLGSVPACIIVKLTSGSGGWIVYHVGTDATNPEQKYLQLNSTNAVADQTWPWNDTAPTDTEFTVGTGGNINANGSTYVAYLFASDAGGFGDDGDESIIKCGSYTGNGGTQEINLGFEPQWLLVKSSTQVDSWFLTDTMRGMPNNAPTPYLLANLSNAEADASAGFFPQATATGFKIGASGSVNASGQTFIYIAIRRPMKTPESGTEVFAIDQWEGATTLPTAKSGFPVDMAIWKDIDGSDGYAADRMRGRVILRTNTTGAETSSSAYGFDYQNGYLDVASNDATRYSWMFKRATGFFDVVCFDGVNGATAFDHGLTVVPEMMIVKKRNAPSDWTVYHTGYPTPTTNQGALNLTGGSYANASFSTIPTSTQFTFNAYGTGTQVAYLFATLDGVSKVGSYTGTGSNVNVDCGFSAGARFILIKRTDSTGDWYVWDSVRGIVAGNDPYLLLNSTAAEVTTTDYIDPLASGFTVTSTAPAALNASGGTYIFLAIA